jgi:hypothetical protein
VKEKDGKDCYSLETWGQTEWNHLLTGIEICI